MTRLRSVLTLSPLKISIGYFIFGVLWIPVTDIILALFFAQQIPTLPEVVKGWTFIGLSTLLIFSLSRLHQQQMTTAQTKLETTNQQLQVLQRVFRHNIRNDLNVIHGYTGMISEHVSKSQPKKQLTVVQETVDQLISVSEKLEIIEQVDPTLSNGHVVNLTDLVNSEVEKICSSHPAVTIEIDAPDQVWVEGDTSLQYAIREALDNAIAHHDQPTADCEISIKILYEDDMVTLKIADNGPGIPQEELQALRTQEETPLVHMSSIGLWLVTWVCRLHNGSVEFRAENGTIVRFRFQAGAQLPLVEPESLIQEKLSAVTA